MVHGCTVACLHPAAWAMCFQALRSRPTFKIYSPHQSDKEPGRGTLGLRICAHLSGLVRMNAAQPRAAQDTLQAAHSTLPTRTSDSAQEGKTCTKFTKHSLRRGLGWGGNPCCHILLTNSARHAKPLPAPANPAPPPCSSSILAMGKLRHTLHETAFTFPGSG